MKKRLLHVAGASCSRPSMERPAPSFEWPKHLLLLSFAKSKRRGAERAEDFAEENWGVFTIHPCLPTKAPCFPSHAPPFAETPFI